MHSIWDRYYADADGLIFVVDATDRGRFERVKKTMCEWGAGRVGARVSAACAARPTLSRHLPTPLPVTVLQHAALADIPLCVLANKSDAPGCASTTEVHDTICRAEGSPLGSGAGGSGGLTSGGGGAGGGRGQREYRIFTCSTLSGDGVRQACEWIISSAKQHMYTRERDAS